MQIGTIGAGHVAQAPMKEIAGDARAGGAPDRPSLPVAGDDNAAKQLVMQLTNEFGFDALDSMSLR